MIDPTLEEVNIVVTMCLPVIFSTEQRLLGKKCNRIELLLPIGIINGSAYVKGIASSKNRNWGNDRVCTSSEHFPWKLR